MAENVQLYSVEECYLSLNGTRYPVSQFTLDLSENGIPTLSVGIDMHSDNSGSDPLVNPFDITTYFNWYEKAQKLCDTRSADTQFYFKLKGKEQGTEQELIISNWICIQPGFNRATASASTLSAGITLMHPVINLDCAATHLFSPTIYVADPAFLDNELMTGINDILSCFVKCLEVYASKTPKKAINDENIKALYDSFMEMTKNITKYLKFKGGQGIPFKGRWTDDANNTRERAIKHNMWDYAAQMAAENPWTLIKQVCMDWFLTILPEETFSQMIVTPFTPWQKPSHTINIENISSVSLPSQSVLPILGA